jgi:fumarate reductase flavoprotein subunit
VLGRPAPVVSPAAADAAMRHASAPLARGPRGDLYALQRALRDAMWDQVGLVRDGDGLRDALGAIERVEAELAAVGVPGGTSFNIAWHDWLNLGNQVTVARLIATSAIERRESRGAHYRRDFPETDPAAPYVVRVQREDDTLRVWREPVVLTRVRPTGALATVDTGD